MVYKEVDYLILKEDEKKWKNVVDKEREEEKIEIDFD